MSQKLTRKQIHKILLSRSGAIAKIAREIPARNDSEKHVSRTAVTNMLKGLSNSERILQLCTARALEILAENEAEEEEKHPRATAA